VRVRAAHHGGVQQRGGELAGVDVHRVADGAGHHPGRGGPRRAADAAGAVVDVHGAAHGVLDRAVAGAAADVALERAVEVVLGALRHRGDRAHHARRAEPALEAGGGGTAPAPDADPRGCRGPGPSRCRGRRRGARGTRSCARPRRRRSRCRRRSRRRRSPSSLRRSPGRAAGCAGTARARRRRPRGRRAVAVAVRGAPDPQIAPAGACRVLRETPRSVRSLVPDRGVSRCGCRTVPMFSAVIVRSSRCAGRR
jgi:hypothetical protein